MAERAATSRDELLERRRREIVESVLADTELMEQVKGSIADPAPAVPLKQVQEELRIRRTAGNV